MGGDYSDLNWFIVKYLSVGKPIIGSPHGDRIYKLKTTRYKFRASEVFSGYTITRNAQILIVERHQRDSRSLVNLHQLYWFHNTIGSNVDYFSYVLMYCWSCLQFSNAYYEWTIHMNKNLNPAHCQNTKTNEY